MARRKTGDKKGTGKKNRAANEEVNNVQADNYSIAFTDLHVDGDVGGDIRIGHTIGYTAEQVSVLLKQITTTLEPKKFDGRCPYKGLEVFEDEDAELFFGRERLVNELVGRMRESRTVFITGPSGSGKSSLVRAGLIHALKNGAIKSSDRWLYETMKPGREPIKDLALAFSRLKSPELEDYFLAHVGETDILNKCAESVLSGRKDQRFVLFIDQFEEVFTQVNQEAERVAFINMLAHAGTVENGRVIVLFAMRSDFVSNCATYPALNELLSQEFRQIGAMQPEELVSAIALPARHVGLPIEDELIARIINDMKGEPGALPLMQFALKGLFDAKRAEGGVIALTLEDYLKHGGIHKSLERHADATFAKLNESEQELTRSIFSGLIEIGRGTQDTKRTALFDELIPANVKAEDVLVIVQKLADARLIITDEQAGKDTVTIAHEKLIEAWPWLKKLVNENRDAIALQNEIANDAKEWEDHNQDESYLYSGARLANAREQLGAKRILLSDLSQIFVASSQEAEDAEKWKEEQRRQKELDDARRLAEAEAQRAEIEMQRALEQELSAANLRKRSLYLTIALAAALIGVGVAVFFGFQSRQQTRIALARQLAAQAQSIYATGNSKQEVAVLLAVRSIQLFPEFEAVQILQNNTLAPLITSFPKQGMPEYIAASPDGKYIISGSVDGTAKVWDTATQKEVAQIKQDHPVYIGVFSASGRYLVSASCNRMDSQYDQCSQSSIHILEVLTGNEIISRVVDAEVSSAAFSPDDAYLILGMTDTIAHVWDISTGTEIARRPHYSDVEFVTFTKDGKIISGDYISARVWRPSMQKGIAEIGDELGSSSTAALSEDGKYFVRGDREGFVTVWETSTWKTVASMQHGEPDQCQESPVQCIVYSVAVSPDDHYVVSGSQDTTARVWEISTGREIARVTHDGEVKSVRYSPDGKYVVSGGDDGTARVWEALTGREVARMTHPGSINFALFASDGRTVVSAGDDFIARVWKFPVHNDVAQITHANRVRSVLFSLDGNYFISGSEKDKIRVWDIRDAREISRLTSDVYVDIVALSPDGNFVMAGGGDGDVQVQETLTGKEIAHMTHDKSRPYHFVTSVAFSPDGKYVVSGSADNTARVWEISTGHEIARITYDRGSWVRSVAFSPDGKYVVSGGDDGTARVSEASTAKEIARVTHDSWVNSVAFSPDGKYVVSVSGDDREDKDNSIRVWEAATGQEIARMTHNKLVTSVAFSPDGRYIVSGSWDHTARVWEAATGKEIARMTHNNAVYTVLFSPDGKYVASSGCDDPSVHISLMFYLCPEGTVRVWEAMTGNEVARMTHNGEVWTIAFSPDGQYIASGSEDGTARIWFWRSEDLIADSCHRVTRNLTPSEWQQYIGDALPYPTKLEDAICTNLQIEPEVVATPSATP